MQPEKEQQNELIVVAKTGREIKLKIKRQGGVSRKGA
jgi:hypothetical protein